MNILLLWPPNPEYCLLTEEFSCCEPLGLEYIASNLLGENEVDIIDMRFNSDLMAFLSKKKYNIVGLCIPFSTSINVTNKILEKIHNYDPSIICIIGGNPPSVSLVGIHLEYVDYVIIGEGGFTFAELVKTLKQKKDVRDIKGIAIPSSSTVHYTEKRPLEDLNTYPLPARELLKGYHSIYFHAHYKPVSLIRFSLGCPYNCSFCILWKMTNRKYLTRKNKNIIDEIITIDNQNLYVVDDEAFINPPKMFKLAEELIHNRICKQYHMYVRSDTVVNNPLLFDKWAEAGLDSVLVGLESINPKELDFYKKKISLNIARQCVEILHKNNIEIRANFIIQPNYDIDDFKRVRDTVLELNIDRPTFAVLTPFIGTDVYDKLHNQFITNKFDFFDCYHTFLPTKLSLQKFYKEFADLFRIANSRDTSKSGNKIFYSGQGDSFGRFLKKIENSYLDY